MPDGSQERSVPLEQRVADLEAYCEQQQATIDRLVTVLQAFGAASQLLD